MPRSISFSIRCKLIFVICCQIVLFGYSIHVMGSIHSTVSHHNVRVACLPTSEMLFNFFENSTAVMSSLHILMNCLFFSFPRGVTAVQLNEARLRHDINFAVRNIFGARSYLFTPYMVFEAVMRKQVERLKEPVLACIDSVVEQLTSAVRNCTKHVS